MISSIEAASMLPPTGVSAHTKNAVTEFDALFYQTMLQSTHLFQSLAGGSDIGMWESFFVPQLAAQLAQQHTLGFGNLILTQTQPGGDL